MENETSICYAEYTVQAESKQIVLTITDVQCDLPEFQEWIRRIFHETKSVGQFTTLYIDKIKEAPKRTNLVATYQGTEVTTEVLGILDQWCLRARELRF